ncbi:HipA family kinase [Vibrio astriarenae]
MVNIEKIVRQMKQGQTGPYLCVGDDGHQYIVKGPNTTYAGLIHEWVCGKLGQHIGLPIPEFDTAYIVGDLIEYDSYQLSEGEWFASKYEQNIQDVPFQALNTLDSSLLKLLFFFDYWVKNGDRNLTNHGGNPNLFIGPDMKSCFVLDHNLAFDCDYDIDSIKDLHVGKEAWFAEQLSLLDKTDYTDRIDKALERLDEIFESVPDEWLEQCHEDSILDSIRVVLHRIYEPEFWEGIK